MANYKKAHSSKNATSDKSFQESESIAKGIKKPGQTKEQTKLITQGIQKGIDIYKKQQKAKSRELDKQLKKAKQSRVATTKDDDEAMPADDHSIKKSAMSYVPWGLLIISWGLFLAYFFKLIPI